ncbi:MAG: hypothetical protein KJO65_03440 [Gemmatimonadetes bacterium]|nr:hypothetical protein [Gemmatimonadota bacterium]
MITISFVVLAVLAYLGRSLVMLCSVGGMAIALWLARDGTIRVKLLALLVGGVGASLAAEVVHVVHHVVVADDPDHSGFWVSAVLVGLIDVAAMLPAVGWTWLRSGDGSSALAPSPDAVD